MHVCCGRRSSVCVAVGTAARLPSAMTREHFHRQHKRTPIGLTLRLLPTTGCILWITPCPEGIAHVLKWSTAFDAHQREQLVIGSKIRAFLYPHHYQRVTFLVRKTGIRLAMCAAYISIYFQFLQDSDFFPSLPWSLTFEHT